jgi:hypothetical protein
MQNVQAGSVTDMSCVGTLDDIARILLDEIVLHWFFIKTDYLHIGI